MLRARYISCYTRVTHTVNSSDHPASIASPPPPASRAVSLWDHLCGRPLHQLRRRRHGGRGARQASRLVQRTQDRLRVRRSSGGGRRPVYTTSRVPTALNAALADGFGNDLGRDDGEEGRRTQGGRRRVTTATAALHSRDWCPAARSPSHATPFPPRRLVLLGFLLLGPSPVLWFLQDAGIWEGSLAVFVMMLGNAFAVILAPPWSLGVAGSYGMGEEEASVKTASYAIITMGEPRLPTPLTRSPPSPRAHASKCTLFRTTQCRTRAAHPCDAQSLPISPRVSQPSARVLGRCRAASWRAPSACIGQVRCSASALSFPLSPASPPSTNWRRSRRRPPSWSERML